MAIESVKNYSIGLQQTPKASLKSQQSSTPNPEVDEEKSNATKYMIGATALAAVIGLGVAGYKGKLGKSVQKFLGGAENAVEKGTQNASENAGSVSKPLTSGTESVGSKASDALVDGVEKEVGNVPTISSATENVEKGVSKVDDALVDGAENGMAATPKAEVPNEQPLNETSGLKPEIEAEPKTNPKTETNTKAELEAEAKAKAEAEEKAFIEKHKQALIDKLHEEGEQLFRTSVKKYDDLVKRFAHQRTKFDKIPGQRSEKHGLFIIEQQLGKGAKKTSTTMTYYSKDGKNIDKVVCTRDGKKAYQVTYCDNGQTVELSAKDLFIEGDKNGIIETRSRKNHVCLDVYNYDTQMEISRQDYSNGGFKQLGIRYEKGSEGRLVSADKESICDYLNITD